MKRVEDLACSALRSSTLRVLRTHHESYVDAVPLLGPQDVGVESRVRVLTNQVSWASASQSGGVNPWDSLPVLRTWHPGVAHASSGWTNRVRYPWYGWVMKHPALGGGGAWFLS